MNLERYFIADSLIVDTHAFLTDEQAKHCRTVMRNKPGDRVVLFNGFSGEYIAEIINLTKKDINLKILEFNDIQRTPSVKISLFTAIPRQKRFDFLIEKVTELGASEIIPLITKRSGNVSTELSDAKLSRYKTKIIETCKQCGRNILPTLCPAKSLESILTLDADLKIILHPYSEDLQISGIKRKIDSIMLAVGPEGGFTEDEVQSLQNKGWLGLSIGQSILRVETAAISALTLMIHYLDSFH